MSERHQSQEQRLADLQMLESNEQDVFLHANAGAASLVAPLSQHALSFASSPSASTAALFLNSDANIRNFAPVARIMKNALPENAKIAKEAKECMQECVSEFISFITSEGTYSCPLPGRLANMICETASEKCQQEKRKTVNGEDILFAMNSLGFENYAEALKVYLTKYREVSQRTLARSYRNFWADPCLRPLPSAATNKEIRAKLARPDSNSQQLKLACQVLRPSLETKALRRCYPEMALWLLTMACLPGTVLKRRDIRNLNL